MELIDKRKLIEHCFDVFCKLDNQGDNIAADALKKHILWYLVDAESVDAAPVVRCAKCVAHGNCITEDAFVLARINNPFCCAGKQKEGAD